MQETYTVKVTEEEFNSVLAGLRLLARHLYGESLDPGNLDAILSNGYATDPLTPTEIDYLADALIGWR